jgi:hypothetical protein
MSTLKQDFIIRYSHDIAKSKKSEKNSIISYLRFHLIFMLDLILFCMYMYT